ncbi:13363_t:CDS:2 [Cetraspora pellucida]|uniref:13363_t:CDS:1 n=1 Tax=Cetraspora pellucida TaxID=1433469 RepID=A0ACA9KVL1_9GLOM|nr:13363_t:CDS:2 [Cetraspora pellucida]
MGNTTIVVVLQIVNTKLKLKDKINSNLMNENIEFYNNLTLSNDSWNVEYSRYIALQTFNVDND